MWGSQRPRDFHRLKQPIRILATSSSGHEIVYNKGNKLINADEFQVSIIENVDGKRLAYSMGDVDYFEIIKKYYFGTNIRIIDLAIRSFVKFIDENTGFYKTYSKSESGRNYLGNFDINSRDTFGYQDNLIAKKIKNFQDWFQQQEIENNAELEEALIIIFLAMISEWYYLGRYNNKSKWQHRVKLFGIYQVTQNILSPEEASQWSKKSKNILNFGKLCREIGIFDKEFRLT